VRIRWAWATTVALVLAGSVGLAYPIVRGYTDPAFPQLAVARRALDEARRADAATWAPEDLADAETAFHQASAEHRRQEVRLLPFRDFRAVKLAIAASEQKSRAVRDLASRRARTGTAAASDALAEAEQAVAESVSFAEAVPLTHAERSTYLQARLALEEARLQRSQGAVARSTQLAERAVVLAHDVTERAASTASRYRDPALVSRWRHWIDETVSWSTRTGDAAIVVMKDSHQLMLYDGGRSLMTCDVDLGPNWAHDKRVSRDAATPEGRYKVAAMKSRGQSHYYKALLLDYPNAEDRARFERARRQGEIPRGASPGGLIEIHGEGGRGSDWTRGCVAVRNTEMDRIFQHVRVGTPVTIVGGDGGDGRLAGLVDRHRRESPTESP